MRSYTTIRTRGKPGRKRTSNWDQRTDGGLAASGSRSSRNSSKKSDDKSNPFTLPDGRDGNGSTVATMRRSARTEIQRRALVALRARLLGDVTETADGALSGCGIESTCASPDVADRASEIVAQDLALSLLGSANGTLVQIETAIQHIDDGSYGRCRECGARIPSERLEAIPYATCCVTCAARQERAD